MSTKFDEIDKIDENDKIDEIDELDENDEIDEICQSLSSPLCHFVENRFLRGDLSFEDTSPKLWGRVLGSSP